MRDGYFKSTGLVFAALLCVGGLPRRRWRVGILMAVLGMAVIGGMLGCGGGSSSGTNNPGTTTGSYQVTVTATSGTATTSTAMPLSLQ
jgi:hypothetical protein